MGVMFYPLDHLLMRAASITGNREVKVNQAFFFLPATATIQCF